MKLNKTKEIEKMKTYINISEKWGDTVEVTVDDYRQQAVAFGENPNELDIEETNDGIFVNDEQVAEPKQNKMETEK